MIRGLNAGFGEPLAHELPALRDLGVQLVRTDCQQLDAPKTLARVIEIFHAGLIPLPIIGHVFQLHMLPHGTHVELRNEPDLEGPSPAVYEGMVIQTARECERYGLTLWAGAVSNLHQRGLEYLAACRPDRWPASVRVSVHRYPHGDTPQTPHTTFTNRESEVNTLRRIITSQRKERTWGVSEFGYHTANRAKTWERYLGIRRQWTDDQVAEFVAWEWAFWSEAGAAGACLYQLNDGPTSAAIDRYGIRTVDGAWKPVSTTFLEAA